MIRLLSTIESIHSAILAAFLFFSVFLDWKNNLTNGVSLRSVHIGSSTGRSQPNLLPTLSRNYCDISPISASFEKYPMPALKSSRNAHPRTKFWGTLSGKNISPLGLIQRLVVLVTERKTDMDFPTRFCNPQYPTTVSLISFTII